LYGLERRLRGFRTDTEWIGYVCIITIQL